MSEPTAETELKERRMNRADLLTGIVFVIGGLIVAYWSWVMPRLEIRGIHPATVPGLVPGLLGSALALCGAVLAINAYRKGRDTAGWRDFFAAFASVEAGRFYIVAGLALVYSLILVGLVPFWLASALFVFAFIVVFEAWLSSERKPLARSAFWAAVQALIVGGVVTLVFQYGFLVRLP